MPCWRSRRQKASRRQGYSRNCSGLADASADRATDPQRQRRRLLAALIEQLETLARNGPVLMLFEDVHWADPTSIEL